MQTLLLLLLIFAAVFIESSVTTLPILLDCLLIAYILRRKSWVFGVAFLSGIILDTLSVRGVGQSSLFFLIFLLIVALYENKFETQTVPFVFSVSFLGSIAYLLVFGYSFAIQQALVSSLISVLLFVLLNYRREKLV